ncbi:MAG TPA: protein kinase [Bryobacteraceae bacterium]|nr:protein kinase [Bryobacteraceae bacterium]
MAAQIGKYKVERELGRGGFGQVYLGLDRDIGRQVAIKVLLANGDAEKLKRFQAEIGTTGNLRHKNIVTIYESGEEAGNPYLVMELLEGETLREVIAKSRPLSIPDKVKIMTQVAEGLAHAHSREVVHRDVKPENIMLLPDGTVKIMDFGIALAPNRLGTMTQTGFMVGTLNYMAPEQFTQFDVKANEQTDIFAYGNVYYELLTGRHPFIEIVKQLGIRPEIAIGSYDPAPIASLVRDCPEALEQLVHRALAKNPAFRYKKFSEIIVYGQEIVVDLQHEQTVATISEASRLLEIRDWEGARAKAQEAQQLEPWNLDARRVRDQADRLIRQAAIREQVAALLSEAEQRMTDRRFHEAVQNLESAAHLDTANEAVRSLLGVAKARLEASVRAKRLIEEARSKEDQGQLSEASEALRAALELEPGHAEAERLARRVAEKLRQRDKDRRQEGIHAASIHFAAKEYSQALSILDAIEQEQPGSRELAEFRALIIREQAAEEQCRRIERFQMALARTRETLQNGDLHRVAEMIAHLQNNFGGEPGAEQALADLREQWNALNVAGQIARYRQQVQDMLARQAFPEALALLEKALLQYPQDATLLELKRSAGELWAAHRRSEAIAKMLLNISRLRQAGEFDEALATVSDGRREFGEDPALVELAVLIETEIKRRRYAEGVDRLLRVGNEMIAAGRCTEAIQRLDSAPEYAGTAELRALRALAVEGAAIEEERAFAGQALAAVEAARSAEEREQALAALQRALGRYPRNVELEAAADRLRGQVSQDRRELSIQSLCVAIRQALEAGDSRQSEKLLQSAHLEFPAEQAFEDLARQIVELQYQTRLKEVEAGVREHLSASRIPQAAEELQTTRAMFENEPRWQKLAEEVAQRRAYEEALVVADRHRGSGNLQAAEGVLLAALPTALDGRAAKALEAIQVEQWESQRLEAVRQEAERLERESLTAPQSPESGSGNRAPSDTNADDSGTSDAQTMVASKEGLASPSAAKLEAPGVQPASRVIWKPAAAIVTAVLLTVTGAVTVYQLSHRPAALIPFEIRTDPQGATVILGERTCVTPNCRFNLAAGEYQIEATLDGFERIQQRVTIDARNNPGVAELTLRPLPGPPPVAVHTGTLVVRVGQPSALVRVDGKPFDRTGAEGAVSLSLESKIYRVTVEKERYNVSPASRDVAVAENSIVTVEFNLIPKDAWLVLTGAPAGVEVRSETCHGLRGAPSPCVGDGSKLLGRSSGRAEVTFPVPPGRQMLQFNAGGARRVIEREFQPDETARMAWRDVAPAPPVVTTKSPAPAPAVAEPTSEEREAADWALVRGSSDVAAIRAFLSNHPAGAHNSSAQALLDKLTAPPPAMDERPPIRAAVEQYLRSLQAKDEKQLTDVWPQIPAAELDKWKTDFQNTKEIRIVPLNQPTFDITGNTARVTWQLQTEKTYASTPKPYMGEHNTRFTLREENGRWTILSVR